MESIMDVAREGDIGIRVQTTQNAVFIGEWYRYIKSDLRRDLPVLLNSLILPILNSIDKCIVYSMEKEMINRAVAFQEC